MTQIQNPLKLWELENHHTVMINYFELKIKYYGAQAKIKSNDTESNEKRSLRKTILELGQNISEYQSDNQYYLELYKKTH